MAVKEGFPDGLKSVVRDRHVLYIRIIAQEPSVEDFHSVIGNVEIFQVYEVNECISMNRFHSIPADVNFNQLLHPGKRHCINGLEMT